MCLLPQYIAHLKDIVSDLDIHHTDCADDVIMASLADRFGPWHRDESGPSFSTSLLVSNAQAWQQSISMRSPENSLRYPVDESMTLWQTCLS